MPAKSRKKVFGVGFVLITQDLRKVKAKAKYRDLSTARRTRMPVRRFGRDDVAWGTGETVCLLFPAPWVDGSLFPVSLIPDPWLRRMMADRPLGLGPIAVSQGDS
jgi:hypothetical protein